MILPNGLQLLDVHELTNKHQNFTQPLVPNASFKLRIPTAPADLRGAYRQTTANFQWLIRYGIDNGLRMRAIGKNWSFTKVGVTNGGIIDANALTTTFGLRAASVDPAYLAQGKSASNLFFAECGITVHSIEQLLEASKKSVRASGASNGQTIVGAISTGTHGAAFDFGAVQDTVLGIHLVCGPDRHVWLERASNPVTKSNFTDNLGISEVLRNDDLFNAVLVSFGSFGFIHGVLLDVENLFWLKSYSVDSVPYTDALKKAMTTCDFSGIANQFTPPLPASSVPEKPYHFQLMVNPHQFDLTGVKQEQGAFVRILYKHSTKPDQAVPPPPKPDFIYGDDTLGLMQKVLDVLRPSQLVPFLVNQLYPAAKEQTNGWVGTMMDFFAPTDIRGKAASAAIGMDSRDSPRVLEKIIELNKQGAFPGVLGLRWVKKTSATLGFTRFPITCVLELDGIESALTNQFLERVWNALDAEGIPYTMHWGKVNFGLTPNRVRQMYTDASVNSWLKARHQLVDAPTQAVFTNEFMENCDLHLQPIPDSPIV
ncbi:FAD-binding protein [Spirosoma sp. HMF3257]|uniref:FAD-linked oxidase n=1 Tax=Spirosoma telluris TaxID=2183553 RepID=A0A327NH39_9BACT|nr:FAD-binding protein [Spirosoma telluris]RAI74145.1 FAD-linked oxidase [Spirosoma telluris]